MKSWTDYLASIQDRSCKQNLSFVNLIEGLVHGVFAIVEPVAFMGGMFAGLLRLDLKEDPLKEWVTRTVEASGITEEDIDAEGSQQEEQVPLEIEIE
ncbi:hypothetical protein DKX38_017730 [Salix brachista]|uniref:Uncharacterized protein n=1 Tax=Salix brachista TaxID=2182728 RepID=A0A5N5JNC1_9ROSI|nr:hypothetical protein DKX38_027215 [Salix brachista]KAB5534644.1 hypothetical protein DKX38_017730 [Salix brachista]